MVHARGGSFLETQRSPSGPDPARVTTIEDLVRELGLLRSRAAHGTRSARVSLEALAARTGEPRSTIHAYLTGKRFAPAQVLDRVVIALGTSPSEQREWAEAWYRVSADREHAHRPQPPVAVNRERVPHQLPAGADNFTGRAQQLVQLDELLLDSSRSAIALLSGAAGVGKTALALQWAHTRGANFPDGQLYVDLRGFDLRPPLAPAQALSRFLRALDPKTAELPEDEDELAAQFRSALADRRMLLVLDNAADSEQVRELLPGLGGCAVLVTSRDSLTGLITRTGAHRIDLDVLPASEAVALLRGLGAAGPVDQLAQLAELCARLPLALRIAAEQLGTEFAPSLPELVDELADGDRLLDGLEAGDDPRTALRAVLGWSYERLPAAAAQAYRLAGLHPGPDLSVPALAALLDTDVASAQRAMSQLTRLHLVGQSRPGHVRLSRVQRAFARELLAGPDDAERIAAFARLAEHYLHSATRALELMSSKRRPELHPAGGWTVPLADVESARTWWRAERANVAAVGAEVEQLERPKSLLRLARGVGGNPADADRVIRQLPAREPGGSGLLPASSN